MFKIAKQMRKERKDIGRSKYIRDENGTLQTKVKERWRSYFSSLLNKTNECQLQKEDKVEGLTWEVTKQTVEQTLKSMKVSLAPRPSGVTSDLINGVEVSEKWGEKTFSGL